MKSPNILRFQSIRKAPMFMSWVLLSAIILSLFFGKLFKIHFQYYVSDIYVNAESALNFFRFGKPFQSSVFENLSFVHLYWFNLLEGPFLYFFGVKFYALPPLISGFAIFYSINRIVSFNSKSSNYLMAQILTIFFLFNPLLWMCFDLPAFGFQYDVYSLAIVPLFCAFTLTGTIRQFVFWLICTLAIKEELAISVLACSFALFAIPQCRLRAVFATFVALVYLAIASKWLALNSSNTPNTATLIAKTLLIKNLPDYVEILFSMRPENPVWKIGVWIFNESGFTGLITIITALPATICLIVFNGWSLNAGLWALNDANAYWKIVYLFAAGIPISTIYISALYQKTKSSIFKISFILTFICLTYFQTPRIMNWLEKNPEYQISHSINYFLDGKISKRSGITANIEQFNLVQREIDLIAKIAGDHSIVLTTCSQGFLTGDPRTFATYKPTGLGKFLWVMDKRKIPHWSIEKNMYEEWSQLPLAFESENFEVRWSVPESDRPLTSRFVTVRYTRTDIVWPDASPIIVTIGKTTFSTNLLWPVLNPNNAIDSVVMIPENITLNIDDIKANFSLNGQGLLNWKVL